MLETSALWRQTLSSSSSCPILNEVRRHRLYYQCTLRHDKKFIYSGENAIQKFISNQDNRRHGDIEFTTAAETFMLRHKKCLLCIFILYYFANDERNTNATGRGTSLVFTAVMIVNEEEEDWFKTKEERNRLQPDRDSRRSRQKQVLSTIDLNYSKREPKEGILWRKDETIIKKCSLNIQRLDGKAWQKFEQHDENTCVWWTISVYS